MDEMPSFGDDTIQEKTAIWARIDLERLTAIEERLEELNEEVVELRMESFHRVDFSWRAIIAFILGCVTILLVVRAIVE